MVFPLLFILMGITFGLGTGATAVIAQFIGSDEKENANNTAEHILFIGIALGILLNILSFFIGDKLILAQGADNVTLKYSLDFTSNFPIEIRLQMLLMQLDL